MNVITKFKERLEISGAVFFEDFVHEDVLMIIGLFSRLRSFE